MAEVKSSTAVAQSSIGLQIFAWDESAYKFKYLIPLTGDLPPLGSAPSTIECTEADSPVKQYIADRPDSPAIELSYNYLAKYEQEIKKVLNPAKPHAFALLLPLGSVIVVNCTGDTWLEGGSPIQGKLSLVQGQKAVLIADKAVALTADEVALLKTMGLKKGSSQDLTTSDKMDDLIDWATIPAGKINQKPVL